ncbi:hypothetical protein AWB67_01517 [Caballeronia terrestris]|jgi:hypothetical protein|uniref:Uncharacterized protein n=1 Tax=Caballeronia terrestris TaxID=1226301 RepID=A0A158H6S5_9BURK|nr:hypothetical protein AWB67_01517 [Caballeronia terrestris]
MLESWFSCSGRLAARVEFGVFSEAVKPRRVPLFGAAAISHARRDGSIFEMPCINVSHFATPATLGRTSRAALKTAPRLALSDPTAIPYNQ